MLHVHVHIGFPLISYDCCSRIKYFGIEKQSNHPLAKSVVRYLADKIDVGVMNFQTTEIKGKVLQQLIIIKLILLVKRA